MRLKLCAFVFLAAAAINLWGESGAYNSWLSQREALMQDRDVERYYTFEGVKDSGSAVRDVKGSGADLVFVPYREGDRTVDDLKVIEGRFPEKSAVRLDRGWYQGPPVDIKDKGFSLSMWFRRQGPGSLSSASMAVEGSMVSVAGWERGWRVATVFDEINTLRFCIGGQGGCKKVMSDISIPENVWHHIGVTWDGKEMLIYFNGILAGKKEYAGSYSPSRPGDFLRIGYGGTTTGSVVLDIDELVIYGRPLSGEELRSLGQAGFSPASGMLAAADKYIEAGDYRAARREYEKLKSMKSVEYGRELALFSIAESYLLEKDYGSAHRTYREIFSLPDLANFYRIYGLFRQADVYLEQKDYINARRLYDEIVKTEGALENHMFWAQLYKGDTYRKERKYSRALAIYAGLLKVQDTSANPHEGYRLELVDRIEAVEFLADGQEEKSKEKKRLEWINRPKKDIYVSPTGRDSNPGTKARPFATIERAQEEARKIKSEGMPEGGIAVYLRGGKYFLDEGLIFGKEDSGTKNSPVVYRSYPGEEARIIGGRQINGFKPLKDHDIIKRLPEEAKGKVWVADLKQSGINDYGHLRNRGASRAGNPGAMELFYNTMPMQLSRWPDEGWLFVADFVTPGGDEGRGTYAFQRGRFRYSGKRPERWKAEKDIWAAGYFMWPWDKVHTQVIDIDTDNLIVNLAPDIRHAPSYTSYGLPVRKDVPYYFYNILGELSRPGEFYIDREAGKLYFYPPGKIEGSEIIVSTLDAPVLKLQEVSNTVFYGITIECNWHNGVEIEGGRNNLIAGSVIRNTGQYAVNVKNGWRHGLVGCDMHDLGEGGVIFSGGNWKKLIPSGHYADNNHIHHFNRFDGGYRPAFRISGVGTRVSHNLISDSSHQAVMFDNNNHIIEYNEIYDVVHEAKDAGAIYTYGAPRSLVNRGNILRYNFIHHVTEHSSAVPYDNPGINAIYIDALNAGTTMVGNILYRCTGTAIFTHGADSRVENSIFVDNRLSIYHGNRSRLLSQAARIKQWQDNVLDKIRYREPPWAARYPQLRTILRQKGDKNIGWPENVFIERNINRGGQFLKMSEDLYEGNTVRHNIDSGDPLFVNPAGLDLRIRPGSPVYARTGCDPVPFEKIGPYEDKLRATWPVQRSAAGKYYKSEALELLPASRFTSLAPVPFVNKPVVYEVRKKTASISIDGKLDKKEWAGLDKSRAIVIEKYYSGEDKTGDSSYAWVSYDDESLYIGVENTPNPFRDGMDAREKQPPQILNEIAIEGIHGEATWWWQNNIDTGPVYIFWGHSDGKFGVANNFGMPRGSHEAIRKSIEYKVIMQNEEDYHWTAEWKIPFASLNIHSEIPESMRFNIGAAKRGGWFAWVPTGGSVWRIDNAGTLKFE